MDLMIDPLRAWGRQMCWLVAWDTDGFVGEDSKEGSDWAHNGNQQLTWAPSWGTGWQWMDGVLQCHKLNIAEGTVVQLNTQNPSKRHTQIVWIQALKRARLSSENYRTKAPRAPWRLSSYHTPSREPSVRDCSPSMLPCLCDPTLWERGHSERTSNGSGVPRKQWYNAFQWPLKSRCSRFHSSIGSSGFL